MYTILAPTRAWAGPVPLMHHFLRVVARTMPVQVAASLGVERASGAANFVVHDGHSQARTRRAHHRQVDAHEAGRRHLPHPMDDGPARWCESTGGTTPARPWTRRDDEPRTHVHVDNDGVMHVDVTKEVAKGGIPRVVLVLVPRVAERLLERRNRAKGKGFVIGSPADLKSVWEARSRNKGAAALYQELANELGIEVMANERSHVWRTTLRSMYDDKTPAAVLNGQFGRSEKTAQKHNTDASDLSGLASAAGLRAVPGYG